MVGGKRWCFTACALFMLCPRRPYVAASPPHERINSKKPIPKSSPIHSKPMKRTSDMDADKGYSLRLEEAEPGFDFTEEEIKKLKIWPGGAVPYYIDEFSFDKVLRDRIRNFLDVTNSATGLNFLELHRPPGDDETRWVLFVNRQGLLHCVDHSFKNFTNTGVQKILLGYDCLSNNGGELADVVLALVGVPPQHNAPIRNEYIEIVKENIMPGKAHLFEIVPDTEWLFHEVDYDFASAGHYNLHKYTVNGKATITPKNAVEGINIGEGKGFSYTDIWKIRMIYNYISKKRFKSVSVPECNKLFNPGTNFNNYVHESEDEVQPRKKPNKYLGVHDEFENNQFENKETSTPTPSSDKDVSKEDNAEGNSEKEQEIESVDDEPHKTLHHGSNSESNDSEKSDKDHSENKTKENSLSHSDSGHDTGLPHGLKFTRPGQHG